jgi:hypothetical protein
MDANAEILSRSRRTRSVACATGGSSDCAAGAGDVGGAYLERELCVLHYWVHRCGAQARGAERNGGGGTDEGGGLGSLRASWAGAYDVAASDQAGQRFPCASFTAPGVRLMFAGVAKGVECARWRTRSQPRMSMKDHSPVKQGP